MELTVEPVTLRFRDPVAAAHGTLTEREMLRVRLRDDDGNEGIGEAAPLESYDGVTLDQCREALDAYARVFAEAGGARPGDRYAALRDAADLPQALAAVDMAAWDLAGRREGKPVAQMLAAVPARRVEVNATIAAEDRAGAAGQAARAAEAGYRCVKLKVGIGDDAGRVAAVRAAAGPEMALRLDANGAWSVNEAITTIDALAPAGLELVEEPVSGVAALREVRERVSTRIAMDESAAEPGALVSGAADAVCLKLSRAGGISGLLAAAAAVRAVGCEPYIASVYDGPAGIAAAVHCAAALGSMPPCGLATLGLFDDLEDPLPPRDGAIEVPQGPGLGVSFDGQ
jgi:o-succinylbenzoate synthase